MTLGFVDVSPSSLLEAIFVTLESHRTELW